MTERQITSQADLSVETVQQLVENQTKELEAKTLELQLKQQEDGNGFEFGKIALEAKTQDRRECREHERLKGKDRYIFSGAVTVVLAGIIITAMLTNNTDIAKEIIKAVIYVTAGAMGGWGLTKKKAPTPEDDSN